MRSNNHDSLVVDIRAVILSKDVNVFSSFSSFKINVVENALIVDELGAAVNAHEVSLG